MHEQGPPYLDGETGNVQQLADVLDKRLVQMVILLSYGPYPRSSPRTIGLNAESIGLKFHSLQHALGVDLYALPTTASQLTGGRARQRS